MPVNGRHPLKMAREIHEYVSLRIEGLEDQLGGAQLALANADAALTAGARQNPQPWRVRVEEAWRVLRGVVNVQMIREYCYAESRRAGDEMRRHLHTIDARNAEQAETSRQIAKLKSERTVLLNAVAAMNPPPGAKMKPTVCRSVHYVAFGSPGGEYQEGAHRAAIVTEVHFGTGSVETPANVSLAIFNPTGLHFRANVPYDATGTVPGTWHWPEHA